jgi:hypothetical protein
LARKKAIQLCCERWAQLKLSDPDLVQAVLVGNYDTDIAMNNKVFFFVIFLTPQHLLNLCDLQKPHREPSPTPRPQKREKKERESSTTPIFEVSPSVSPRLSPNTPRGKITEGPCMHCGVITTDSCAWGCGAFRHDFCTCKWFVFFVFLKFIMSVPKRLKEGPLSPRPPRNLPRKEPAESPRPPPPRIP